MSPATTIKLYLYCPSLGKVVPFVAWDEEKLDLGSIARTFGLDPSTLKLNGHFISRGADLVSASVTWRSLLSFFSHKGLTTGRDYGNALVVDGKLCKVGIKRTSDPGDGAGGIHHSTELGMNRKLQPEGTISFLQNKKFRESHSGCENGALQVPLWKGIGLKRKQGLVDANQPKKLKTNESNSDFRGKGIAQFMCSSSSSESVKRMREDEVIAAAPCRKKIKLGLCL